MSRTVSLHDVERRATIRAEHVALITVLCAVRAWHLSPDWMHRAARRLGRRA
jgi:hypothetical protein